MSNFAKIIAACRASTGAGSKKVIQQILQSADETARHLICLALDPYTTFGVKQFDRLPSVESTTAPAFGEFIALLNRLDEREITGDAAREAVSAAIANFDADTAEYMALVLDKDLRAGFSADSANKAWKEQGLSDTIPTFEVMLADKCEDASGFDKYVTFPCQADWKYDGQRTIALVTSGLIDYRARSGKPMDHLEGVFDGDLMAIRERLGYDFVIDGESFAGDFTETINAKKAGNDAAKAALRLRAFFLMPLQDWIKQECSITMRENRDRLGGLIEACELSKIVISGGREVKTFQDMTAYCAEVTTPGFDGQPNGHEGLILKDWDARYVWERSMTWCKVKNFYDVDCRVVAAYKGKAKTKNEHRLGGLKVCGYTESGEYVEADVGSGFTDAQREEIWANQARYIGRTVVVKYQEISRSKNKAVASLRFPTFEHFRDDKIVG